MLEILVNTFDQISASIQENISFLLAIILALWVIQVVNKIFGYRLNTLGIYPRSLHGLIGILASPFLHGSFQHLFFNTLPLLILGALVLVNGKPEFLIVTAIIMGAGGFATWLFGRRVIHVGASGVILGYWGYLLFRAIEEKSALTIVLGLLCLYYFGSLALNLFPREERVSWEGHLFGFLSGLLASYLITHHFFALVS
ncbi:MAG TPA: rhomboid family intramembrane serine protease [Gammaproteobacteria bacterium]|nr:rhomboid family intramembrane serine protease [Gammaproteobacteria bacterium]